jgi:Zn-dependent protease with chaperone function
MLRRLRVAVGAAVVLIAPLLFFLAVFILQGSGNAWLWVIEAVVLLAVMLAPRAILLAVARRYEYRADQTAAELLGSPNPVIAFLDWLPTVSRDDRWPLPVRPWTAAHPSTAARRQAMLRRDVGPSGQASEGR